jgi:N6-L-threonylcarbamoyladenine synthase
MAIAHRLPLVGIHHVEAHLHSVTLENEVLWPHLALVVSGGHTDLFLALEPGRYRLLARTRDDAAGEAYDKVGKLLGLGYPAGPTVDRLVAAYDGPKTPFPLPTMRDGSLDFSYSGLKSAALRMVEAGAVRPLEEGEDPVSRPELLALLAGFQEAVVDQLLDRSLRAVEEASPAPRGFSLSGGVSANSRLRERAREAVAALGLPLWVPATRLSTDNAVMVAALGAARLERGERDDLSMTAEASIPLGETA